MQVRISHLRISCYLIELLPDGSGVRSSWLSGLSGSPDGVLTVPGGWRLCPLTCRSTSLTTRSLPKRGKGQAFWQTKVQEAEAFPQQSRHGSSRASLQELLGA